MRDDKYEKQRTEDYRDTCAFLAMSALITNGDTLLAFNDGHSPTRIAQRAYEYANAMVKEREKQS